MKHDQATVFNAIGKNGEWKNVNEVANGLKCDCTCPICKSKMIAVNRGKIQVHHFRHDSKNDCSYHGETALHLLGKSIIQESMLVLLPTITMNRNVVIQNEMVVKADRVQAEKRVGKFTPDLLCTVNGCNIWVEIFVTHEIDQQKREYVVKNGIPLIEYDLSKFIDKPYSYDDVSKHIYNGKAWHKFLCNTR